MSRRYWFGGKHSKQSARPARRLAVERLEERLAPALSVQSLLSAHFSSNAQNSPLLVVPGPRGSQTTLTFEWTDGDSRLDSEVGVFVVDGAGGRVNGVKPTQANYSRRALNSPSRQVLFERGDDVGASEQLTFEGGQRLGFYLIRNGSAEQFLARNPANSVRRAPVAFFSAAQANPDRRPHLRAAAEGGGVTLQWEDSLLTKRSWRGRSTRELLDFNDIVFRMTVGTGDTQPPTVTIVSPAAGTLANTNFTVSGQVIDDRSGVASLQARLDTGAPFNVAVDGLGGFQFTTALALNGTADGVHTISLSATDGAGNTSSPQQLAFTLFAGGLGGAVSAPANDHIPDVFIPEPADGDLAIDDRPNGTGLETSRTRLMVQFKDTATVGDVNALLQSLGARILGTVAEIDLVLIGIPDTGDFSGLDHALAILDSHPAIALVVQDVALGVSSLPEPTDAQDPGPPVNAWVWNNPPSTINGSGRDGNWGLEAVRAPQMWNLNDYGNRSTSHPRTGVLDGGFNDVNSDGVNDHPDGDLAGLQTWQATEFGLTLGASAPEEAHGQHVAGIIGAAFHNGLGVAGINPLVERHSPTDNHFVGVSARVELVSDTIYDLGQMLEQWPDLRVVNISMGYTFLPRSPGSLNPSPNDNLEHQRVARLEGLVVRQLMAIFPETLIVGAAGNESSSGWFEEIEAQWISPWNWAGLAGDITDEDGVLWHNSPNILVVESVDGVVGNPASPSYSWQYSKSDFSDVGGNVTAPGGRILSTVGSNLPEWPNYATFSGTSMAAPHVTGLIGYLLTLDPTLSVAEIRTLITDPAYTRTTVLRNNNGIDDDGDGVVDQSFEEEPLPAGVTGPAPMIDAFAAAMGIDLITGDADKSIQRALVDVDDGTNDGNLRFDPLVGVAVDAVITTDGLRGDGRITMRDFRAWRDAYIELQSDKFVAAGLDVTLDGVADHAKKDLNFNGVVPGDDHLYPRYDFNGDGSVLDWSATAPFKIDPDTPLPIDPNTGFPAPPPNHSTEIERLPGLKRDIDVLADPAFWSQLEADGYNEGVNVFPVVEGTESHSFWTESRYLLANRDPDSASDFLKDLPDYIHSFDVHVNIDWTALDYSHDAVLLRIDSEMAGPSFGERFRREAIIPAGTADFVVTIPLWTGRVEVRAAGFDRDSGTLPDLDQASSPRENWPGVKIGEDRALKLTASRTVLTDLRPLLAPYGVTSSLGVAINNLGQVVVDAYIDATESQHVFLVEPNGTVTDLHPVIGGGHNEPVAINDAGQVTGLRYSSDYDVTEGFIYVPGENPTVIGLGDRRPVDMNESGEVVGSNNNGSSIVGFRYSGGVTTGLAFIPNGINDLGHIVGHAGVVGAPGVLYIDGETTPIGQPPIPGVSRVVPTAINNAGLIAGQYYRPSGDVQFANPFLLENGTWKTYPNKSFAAFDVKAINEDGVAVGNHTPVGVFGGFNAWVFDGNDITNLDTLIVNSTFTKLPSVRDINDRGAMVGTGSGGGLSGAFVVRRVL